MPHLDANALTDDPAGMAFLGHVLDLQVELPAAADIAAGDGIARVRDAIARPVARADKAPRTRRARRPVFEAA